MQQGILMNVIFFLPEKRSLFSLIILFDIGQLRTFNNNKNVFSYKMKFMNREYILKFITRLYEILIPVLKYFCFSPRRIVKPQVTHIKNKNTSCCTTFIRFYFYNQKRDLPQDTFYVIQVLLHSHTLNMVDSQGSVKGRCYAISPIVKHIFWGGGVMVFFFKQEDHNSRF